MIRFDHHPAFITITCLNWLPILQNDLHKQIALEALKMRVKKEQVTICGFVIMPNHIHLIWQLHDGVGKSDFQRELLKFTSRSLLAFMKMNNDRLYHQCEVNDADRKYQVWERNSLSVELYSEKVFMQKLEYIHSNPIHWKWRLADLPENYRFSSAKYYESGVDENMILTHYRG